MTELSDVEQFIMSISCSDMNSKSRTEGKISSVKWKHNNGILKSHSQSNTTLS